MGRIVAAVLFLLLLPASALGQDQPSASTDASSPATVSRDPSALALLSQCASVMGAPGPGFDFYAQGQLNSGDPRGPSGPIAVKGKGLNVRSDITFNDGQETRAVNGSKAWAIRQGKRSDQPYSAAAYYRPEFVPALACTTDLARPYMSAIYVGLEKVSDRQAYHVRFNAALPEDKDGSEKLISEFHVFIDQATGVVLKTQSFAFSPDAIQNYSTFEIYYGDYRQVNGVLMPFRVESYSDGQRLSTVTFTSVQTNVGISDSEFN